MITLYGSPNTRSLRATWMMEELEQDYDYVLIDFAKGDSRSPAFLAINPAGKLPALRDDDWVLTESAAIISYLGRKFPDRQLLPTTDLTRLARYEQWSYFALSELEQPLWSMAKHKFALPKEMRRTDIFSTAEWEFQRALQLLSDGLADNTFILGEQFSGADILLSQILAWGKAFDQHIPQPNLIDYSNRTAARPARARAVQREREASISISD